MEYYELKYKPTICSLQSGWPMDLKRIFGKQIYKRNIYILRIRFRVYIFSLFIAISTTI